MKKNILIGLALVILAGGGYYQFSYKPAQEAAAAAEAEAKAAEEAAAAAEAEAAAAAKAAEEAAAAAAKAAEEAAAALATLDPANFDAAKVNAMIAASTLDDATKTKLTDAIDAAAGNPALVGGALAAVKAALGM